MIRTVAIASKTAHGAVVPINPMLQDWDLAAKLRAELIKQGYEEPSFVSADDGMPFKFVSSQVPP